MQKSDLQLTNEQVFELEKHKIKLQSYCFAGLLFVVTSLNIAPLIAASWRRPPDSILNKIGESNLLLTGSLATGFSYFMGFNAGHSQSGSGSRSKSRQIRLAKPTEKREEDAISEESPRKNT